MVAHWMSGGAPRLAPLRYAVTTYSGPDQFAIFVYRLDELRVPQLINRHGCVKRAKLDHHVHHVLPFLIGGVAEADFLCAVRSYVRRFGVPDELVVFPVGIRSGVLHDDI